MIKADFLWLTLISITHLRQFECFSQRSEEKCIENR